MSVLLWICVAIPVVALFAVLVRSSNQRSAQDRQVMIKKWEELYAAIRQTHQLFAQKQVTNTDAIDTLINAATHLAPPNWMVSTRRIISANDYLQHYGEGLELVKKARETAGV